MDVLKEIKKIDYEIVSNEGKKYVNNIYSYIINNIYTVPTMYDKSFLFSYFYSINVLSFVDYAKGLSCAIDERRLKVRNLLRNTETYIELYNEYQNFIDSIAEYLKTKNFKNSKEFVIYLNQMVNSGGLSCDDSYFYYQFKYYCEYLPEILGARITEGIAVCRHLASFITDVAQSYGYDSCNSYVYNYCVTNTKHYIKKGKANHQICCFGEDSEKYYYDPTNLTFAKNVIDEEHLQLFGCDTFLYYIDKSSTDVFNSDKLDIYNKVQKLPYSKLDYSELLELKKYIFEKYLKESSEDKVFYKEMQSKINKIKSLSMKMQPMSDNKITDWFLK